MIQKSILLPLGSIQLMAKLATKKNHTSEKHLASDVNGETLMILHIHWKQSAHDSAPESGDLGKLPPAHNPRLSGCRSQMDSTGVND